MLGFRGASEDEFYVIMLNSSALECRWLPNGKFYEIASTEFTNLPEQWQHLAFIYAGRAIELYIDGVLKDWAAAGGVFDDAAVDFLLENR